MLATFLVRPFFIVCTLLLAVSFTACHFSATRLKRPEDKQAAEDLVGMFFENQQKNRPEANLLLFSKEFHQATPPKKLDQLFARRNQLLGRLRHTELTGWKTSVVRGTDPSSQYVLQYKNQYEKGEATETFSLQREENDAIRIRGYRLNSDAFLR